MAPSKPVSVGPWVWFMDKVLPGLFIALTVSAISTSVAMWKTVTKLTSVLENHDQQLNTLKQDIKIIRDQTALRSELLDLKQEIRIVREQSVMRVELLESVKRVEQQLQIAILQAKLNAKISIMPK